jgi:hypothetical protein
MPDDDFAGVARTVIHYSSKSSDDRSALRRVPITANGMPNKLPDSFSYYRSGCGFLKEMEPPQIAGPDGRAKAVEA